MQKQKGFFFKYYKIIMQKLKLKTASVVKIYLNMYLLSLAYVNFTQLQ
jgi:hypothetical protein